MTLTTSHVSHPLSRIRKSLVPTFALSKILTRPGLLSEIPRARVHPRRPQYNIGTVSEQVQIQSVKNSRVKEARALLQKRHRDKRALIILEGQRLIADALQAAVQPVELYYTQSAIERNISISSLRDSAIKAGSACFLTSDAVIRSLSDTVNPQVCRSFLLFISTKCI